jgi:hypothetical protein
VLNRNERQRQSPDAFSFGFCGPENWPKVRVMKGCKVPFEIDDSLKEKWEPLTSEEFGRSEKG